MLFIEWEKIAIAPVLIQCSVAQLTPKHKSRVHLISKLYFQSHWNRDTFENNGPNRHINRYLRCVHDDKHNLILSIKFIGSDVISFNTHFNSSDSMHEPSWSGELAPKINEDKFGVSKAHVATHTSKIDGSEFELYLK